MSEHQLPQRDPVYAPVTIPDDVDDEITLLIESQDVEDDARPAERDEADAEDELDDDELEDDDEEDDEENEKEVEGKFDEALTRLPPD